MLTSTARALVRAAIDRYEEPASILQDAERIIYQDLSRSEMFTTVFNLRLDFDMSAAYYANAGHTEGIWYSTKDGICHSLPATGIPFGVLKDNEITQKKINLRVGDVLVFYSDGITETVNAKQELFGFERLVGVVTDHISSSAHTLAQYILVEAELFADGAPLADDITLVALKVMPHKVKFDYTATMESLDVILAFIRSNAEGYGEDFAYAVELASSEIITNVIQHAYNGNGGELFGSIHLLADGLEIDFYDMGIVYDPAKAKLAEPGSIQEGGYGLHLINQVMDEVTHKPRDFKGNHWRLVKKLPT
jgi:anti-sigma regulatory factor (Ser/Thr protein kinase)